MINIEVSYRIITDIAIAITILYFILKHIRATEKFYKESRVEWARREAHDKKLEHKLTNYLVEVGLENKRKLSYLSKKRKNTKMYLGDPISLTEKFDYIARNYDEAVSIIKKHGVPNFISFDHDLGADKNGNLLKTGYDLVKWIVDADLDNVHKLPFDFSYKVHSQNPIGKQNIVSLMEGYLKFKNNLPEKITKTYNTNEENKNLFTYYLSNMSKPHDFYRKHVVFDKNKSL